MKLLIIFLMIFQIIFLNKTPLHIALEKGNAEIVELLLSMPNIDLNVQLISKLIKFLCCF